MSDTPIHQPPLTSALTPTPDDNGMHVSAGSSGNAELLERLAVYFTGPSVAGHSMGLSISGRSQLLADEFFAIRSAIGINGYATKDDALAALTNLIEASEK